MWRVMKRVGYIFLAERALNIGKGSLINQYLWHYETQQHWKLYLSSLSLGINVNLGIFLNTGIFKPSKNQVIEVTLIAYMQLISRFM